MFGKKKIVINLCINRVSVILSVFVLFIYFVDLFKRVLCSSQWTTHAVVEEKFSLILDMII